MISAVVSRLVKEEATASNIKSRVNRLSVQSALTRILERLKTYKTVPDNGLALYAGEDGSTGKMIIEDIVPHRPIDRKLYMCDKRFHVDQLLKLFNDDFKYGFVIVDGNSLLIAELFGNKSTILYKDKTVPIHKTRRGGQSANRLARQRDEKKDLWIERAVENVNRIFVNPSNGGCTVSGLVVAGKANTKQLMIDEAKFNPALKKMIIATLDVNYGGINGLQQAIKLASPSMSENLLNIESKVLGKFFAEMVKSDGKFCTSAKDTMLALDMGSVETLIVWDELPLHRYKTSDGKYLYASDGDADDEGLLLDILVDRKDINLILVSNRSALGAQFASGLGGIGALLYCHIDFSLMDHPDGDVEPSTAIDDADFI